MTDAGRDLLARARARRALAEAGSMPAQVRRLQEGSRRLLEDARRLGERFDAADRRRETAEREAAARAEEQALSEAQALPPRARELFEDWRGLGRTAAGALDEVRRSGLVEEEQITEAFQACGLSAEAAAIAARGRGGGVRPVDPFEEMVAFFEARGMSREAARLAAVGRNGTESEARASFAEADVRRDVDGAFWEAARAVAGRYQLGPAEAVEHVKAKVRQEWATLSLAEGVAQLRAYAHQLSS
ncbi:hypothetical protein [Microbispora rosea]|uniref:hypothetical protein n=1 Tax=Microbispora rosea TaxID=58117 RepID=UPI00379BA073